MKKRELNRVKQSGWFNQEFTNEQKVAFEEIINKYFEYREMYKDVSLKMNRFNSQLRGYVDYFLELLALKQEEDGDMFAAQLIRNHLVYDDYRNFCARNIRFCIREDNENAQLIMKQKAEMEVEYQRVVSKLEQLILPSNSSSALRDIDQLKVGEKIVFNLLKITKAKHFNHYTRKHDILSFRLYSDEVSVSFPSYRLGEMEIYKKLQETGATELLSWMDDYVEKAINAIYDCESELDQLILEKKNLYGMTEAMEACKKITSSVRTYFDPCSSEYRELTQAEKIEHLLDVAKLGFDFKAEIEKMMKYSPHINQFDVSHGLILFICEFCIGPLNDESSKEEKAKMKKDLFNIFFAEKDYTFFLNKLEELMKRKNMERFQVL